MNLNDTVHFYTIKLDFKDNKVEQQATEQKVIGINDTYLAIDDLRFTSIKHTKLYDTDKDTLFNDVSVSVLHFANWCDEIRAVLYTSECNPKKAYKKIRKALEKFIYTKHGRYCTGISLLEQIRL